ncbi:MULTISPECIES: hypothetical protein [unclassified Bosea (in: a-proteobacteria)]|uniref:hypothetical protein n=1 Tax=unclassified Bosea (in: a-proteobacteria) TaxID=2653178 RepID=UPI000F762D74|nr:MULTISPECIES: hypothetical protein [unclassified Bosea (in: a-proteobacteria)]AZO77271.1 hypothetical protein BLM15_06330 [Bosea sp. Tri-49]RXT22125.1 hypothetical protein B5U98_16985 [Bosea sp. Tri-39]RXT32467.1 hypothetical protein B5U99_27830 [Bosea sp. Tri-54]
MKRYLRRAGLSLSCLTVLSVGAAQYAAKAEWEMSQSGSAIAAPIVRLERPRLTRPVEPKRNACPRSTRLVEADPSHSGRA